MIADIIFHHLLRCNIKFLLLPHYCECRILERERENHTDCRSLSTSIYRSQSQLMADRLTDDRCCNSNNSSGDMHQEYHLYIPFCIVNFLNADCRRYLGTLPQIQMYSLLIQGPFRSLVNTREREREVCRDRIAKRVCMYAARLASGQ